MKLKSIIWIALAACMAFSACTQEEPIDQGEKVKDGIPTTLDVTVSTEMVTTKAGETLKPGTSEETKINTLAVAIYKRNDDNSVGKFLSFKSGNATELAEADVHGTDNRTAYTLSNLSVETGKVQVLVIANSTVKLAEANFTSYATAKALVEQIKEESGAYLFAADNLVKYADEQAEVSLTNKTLHIELTQLAARVDVRLKFTSITTDNHWQFDMSKYTVSGINVASDIYLKDYTQGNYAYNTKTSYLDELSKEFSPAQSFVSSKQNGELLFTFYTYERQTPKEDATPLKIQFIGELTNVTEEVTESRTYTLELKPEYVAGNNKKTTDGVVHGYLYDATGSIDVTTKNINFEYEVLDWQDRTVEVNIKPIYYLAVKDKVMSMPNMDYITTTYQSSSLVTEILNLKTFVMGEGDPVQDASPQATVDWDKSNNDGTLRISADIPTNYVPRLITFTVKNANGLTEDVEIKQYPPLYIEAKLSSSRKTASSYQTNWNMYQFTSLVADYSLFPYPDELDEDKNIRGNDHNHDNGTDQARGNSFTDYIRHNAQMGYPVLTDEGYTKDTPENNRLISPRFMLASQYGTSNTSSTYAHAQKDGYTTSFNVWLVDSNGNTVSGSTKSKTKQESCLNYEETRGNTVYKDWRLPTQAELYMIDVLQNVGNCAVKAILEGTYYWSANSNGSIFFMDARLSGSSSSRNGAFRCVHDIK
ncbi:fimbrial protein [Parabacteroides sp. PF5-6]|uniref:fimbrial tip adhesin FimD n=1 Tax=Parabacteroides sp. PF5-6 TaxID=1742403 RepID=UPI002406B7CF|nr:fimbrial protein [Parabacteroides sp. PF5-6]MDF9829897.1 hypothetical protein [Parabacteroides sp. PF5-6]